MAPNLSSHFVKDDTIDSANVVSEKLRQAAINLADVLNVCATKVTIDFGVSDHMGKPLIRLEIINRNQRAVQT